MHKPTALYAEDDRETRENFIILLHQYFDTVYSAANGKEALNLYHQEKPDILLLDIDMPYLNGLDLAKTIRQTDSTTPIVIVSAHSDREKLLYAVGLKLDAYLLKPIDAIQFQETMNMLIKQIQENEIVCLRKNLIWNKYTTTLTYKNKPLKITKKECLLISHDELIIHVWYNDIPDHSHDNKLIQLVYRLNKKLIQQLSPNTHLIENSYMLGYKISHSPKTDI